MADTTRADVMSYLDKANMGEISELISEIEEESDKYNLMRKAGEEMKPVL